MHEYLLTCYHQSSQVGKQRITLGTMIQVLWYHALFAFCTFYYLHSLLLWS